MQSITDSPTYVYALIDPQTELPRYIGITSDPDSRLVKHLDNARGGRKSHCYNWLRHLISQELKPEIRILNMCRTREIAGGWERFWITYGHTVAWRLTNSTTGGEKSYSFIEDVRVKISASQKRRMSDPEARARIGAANKIVMANPEIKAKMIASVKVALAKPEVRAKMSDAAKHRPPISDETREKLGAVNRGKKHKPFSEEHRANLRKAWKTRPPDSAETRAKKSAANKGRKLSAEHRAKLIESNKKRAKKRSNDDYKQLPLL